MAGILSPVLRVKVFLVRACELYDLAAMCDLREASLHRLLPREMNRAFRDAFQTLWDLRGILG